MSIVEFKTIYLLLISFSLKCDFLYQIHYLKKHLKDCGLRINDIHLILNNDKFNLINNDSIKHSTNSMRIQSLMFLIFPNVWQVWNPVSFTPFFDRFKFCNSCSSLLKFELEVVESNVMSSQSSFSPSLQGEALLKFAANLQDLGLEELKKLTPRTTQLTAIIRIFETVRILIYNQDQC